MLAILFLSLMAMAVSQRLPGRLRDYPAEFCVVGQAGLWESASGSKLSDFSPAAPGDRVRRISEASGQMVRITAEAIFPFSVFIRQQDLGVCNTTTTTRRRERPTTTTTRRRITTSRRTTTTRTRAATTTTTIAPEEEDDVTTTTTTRRTTTAAPTKAPLRESLRRLIKARNRVAELRKKIRACAEDDPKCIVRYHAKIVAAVSRLSRLCDQDSVCKAKRHARRQLRAMEAEEKAERDAKRKARAAEERRRREARERRRRERLARERRRRERARRKAARARREAERRKREEAARRQREEEQAKLEAEEKKAEDELKAREREQRERARQRREAARKRREDRRRRRQVLLQAAHNMAVKEEARRVELMQKEEVQALIDASKRRAEEERQAVLRLRARSTATTRTTTTRKTTAAPTTSPFSTGGTFCVPAGTNLYAGPSAVDALIDTTTKETVFRVMHVFTGIMHPYASVSDCGATTLVPTFVNTKYLTPCDRACPFA